MILDLPKPVPPVRQTSSFFRIPNSFLFKPSHGYAILGLVSLCNHLSLALESSIIPDGVYVLASHQALVNCAYCPCSSIALASLKPSGKETILALPGFIIRATFLAASLPYLSLSKQIITLSKDSTNSMLSRISLTAPLAPRLIETDAHFLSKIS